MDLVDAFDPAPSGPGLRLICAPALVWTPTRSFDLITSVHGMHYLSDKTRPAEPRRRLADPGPDDSSPTSTCPASGSSTEHPPGAA
ncbi:class I SAM-dependent methyltransferase [Virgisporangium aliadipatigenens]|uniref:class I SAM-dependent methyltransferase n=1 Tax=Virgisporangium aliadipatigenens TaxID=741659 RepID=UPI0019424AA7|nr:class I SAM-dependent methyltransferase [Virgisporangium aliadipatigenens]